VNKGKQPSDTARVRGFAAGRQFYAFPRTDNFAVQRLRQIHSAELEMPFEMGKTGICDSLRFVKMVEIITDAVCKVGQILFKSDKMLPRDQSAIGKTDAAQILYHGKAPP
jgi:hypothetical protein